MAMDCTTEFYCLYRYLLELAMPPGDIFSNDEIGLSYFCRSPNENFCQILNFLSTISEKIFKVNISYAPWQPCVYRDQICYPLQR